MKQPSSMWRELSKLTSRRRSPWPSRKVPSMNPKQTESSKELSNPLLVKHVPCWIALQDAYNATINVDQPVMQWLIQRCGALLARFEVSFIGRPAWELCKGQHYKRPLPLFGECVHFLCAGKRKDLGRLPVACRDGVFFACRAARTN